MLDLLVEVLLSFPSHRISGYCFHGKIKQQIKKRKYLKTYLWSSELLVVNQIFKILKFLVQNFKIQLHGLQIDGIWLLLQQNFEEIMSPCFRVKLNRSSDISAVSLSENDEFYYLCWKFSVHFIASSTAHVQIGKE